ncbi:Cupin region [Candidatus Zixiibacteriota bacterium]|nr:Cupin region [candidate division Zixibacteria bacterium]
MSSPTSKNSGRLDPAEIYHLDKLLDYVPGSIVSRTLIQSKAGTITLFSFGAGQSLSEHTAPYDALVQVLDGETTLTIGGKPLTVKAGETVLMPANVPHAVDSAAASKILLTMIRGIAE